MIHSHKSFSLLEVILAVTFLMVGVVSILGLVVAVLSTVTSARNNVIAAQLAQEGVEIVRSLRDSNWQAIIAWNSGFIRTGSCPGLSCVWRVHWLSNSLQPPAGNPPLLYDSSLGYNYNSGAATIFSRAVTISEITADELQVIVEVTWSERGQNRSVKVEDRLFNWF